MRVLLPQVSSSWLSWGKKYGRIIPTPKEIKVQLKSIQRASKSNDKRLEKLRTDLGNTLKDIMRDEKTNFICVKGKRMHLVELQLGSVKSNPKCIFGALSLQGPRPGSGTNAAERTHLPEQ